MESRLNELLGPSTNHEMWKHLVICDICALVGHKVTVLHIYFPSYFLSVDGCLKQKLCNGANAGKCFEKWLYETQLRQDSLSWTEIQYIFSKNITVSQLYQYFFVLNYSLETQTLLLGGGDPVKLQNQRTLSPLCSWATRPRVSSRKLPAITVFHVSLE